MNTYAVEYTKPQYFTNTEYNSAMGDPLQRYSETETYIFASLGINRRITTTAPRGCQASTAIK